MQCGYFDAGVCRSCTLLPAAYDLQLAEKQRRCQALIPAETWLDPVASRPEAFRNKAKLAIGGVRGNPTLGILDRDYHGIDLTGCGLYEPALHHAVLRLRDWVAESGLTPYDVSKRTGELKHLLVTASPDGDVMLRIVLRSTGQLVRIRQQLPTATVVTVNLLPEHKAVLEGEVEHPLTPLHELPIRLPDVTLYLGPRSFFQTNTAMAVQLYAQAADWARDVNPRTVWDLYCGVGGFGLHLSLALPHAEVHGVEISADAIACAMSSAAEQNLGATFSAGDSGEFVTSEAATADLVVVNPPRRGIGDLAATLNDRRPSHILYSSCNPESFARDLAHLPSYRISKARVFDMFPHTHHLEVLALLSLR